MTTESERPEHASLSVQPEFVTIQIEQAIETFRTQFSLLIQIITLLILADVTVVGYAISTQISGILLVGALFPIVIISAIKRANRLVLPIVYTAVTLEHKYGGDKSDWLATTFLASTVSAEYVKKLITISTQDAVQKTEQLRSLEPPLVIGRGLTRLALALIAIGQIIAPIVLTIFFKWRLP